MTATLCGLGGVRAVIAEHLLLKQQLIVVRRPRQRAPRLPASDRLLFGFGALFLSPGRIRKVAIGVRLSVSNSLSGRHWELDQVPAVGDPTDIVRLGSGAMQRCLNLGFSERIGNSRRTGDDATTALDLLNAVDGPLVRVTADAAYDTVAVYETATARGATVVIPPARTANVSGHGQRSPARDRTITLVKQLGRRQWQKASGYHRQSRVENTFFRYKSIIGDGLRARSSAGQGSEAVLGCEILNRMTALGRPVSYRIGR